MMEEPLDAPEIKQKQHLYPPQKIRQLLGLVVVLMPFNWLGHTWWMQINWTAENLWIMLMIQLLVAVLIAFVVGIYAFFKEQQLPYLVRFGQWFLFYFVVFQVLYALGLISRMVGLT
jgi:hypothetical protein